MPDLVVESMLAYRSFASETSVAHNGRVQIIPVAENDGLEEFIDVQRSFYRDDPHWVPPMREPVTLELSGRSAFSRYGRMQLFVCRAEGCVAGRIAALINPRLRNARGRSVKSAISNASTIRSRVCSDECRYGMAKRPGIREALGLMNGGAHRLTAADPWLRPDFSLSRATRSTIRGCSTVAVWFQ
jgi:hypothetical protein